MKRWILGCVVLASIYMLCLTQFSWGEKPSRIIQRLKTAESDEVKKRELRKILAQSQPEDLEDIDALIDTAKDEKLKYSALASLRKCPVSQKPELKEKIIGLIDMEDDTKEQQILETILQMCIDHKIEGAKEKVRARLRREPKSTIRNATDIRELLKWAVMGDRRAIRIGRVEMLGRALIEMNDTESLDLLFDRDEIISSGHAGSRFAPLGLPALEKAISVVKKEKGLRKQGILDIIGASRYPEALPLLKPLVNDSDSELRMKALHAIAEMETPDADSFLGSLQNHPDERIRKGSHATLVRHNPEKYKDEIINSMRGKGKLDRLSTLYLISSGRVKGIEKELEDFIHEDELKRPHEPMYRELAAKGLWKLTGKKIEYKRGVAVHNKYPWEKP